MATKSEHSSIVYLDPKGYNIKEWRTYLCSACGSIGEDVLGKGGGIRFLMSPEQYEKVFNMTPRKILTPSDTPIAGINYSSTPPSDVDQFRPWEYLDKVFVKFCAAQLATRHVVLDSLSKQHQSTIHGDAEMGMLGISEYAMVTKMEALYDKPSDTRLAELRKIIVHPYRTQNDSLPAHIACNAQAVRAIAQIRGEAVPDSSLYDSLRTSIHQPQLIALLTTFDHDYPSIAQRTYEALTKYLDTHADNRMAAHGDPYATVHAVVATTANANPLLDALTAAAGDPELQGIIAALQAKRLAPSSAAPTTITRPRHDVPHPKTLSKGNTYCFVHGYAANGHSGRECTIMLNQNDQRTGQPFTDANKNATSHVRLNDGTARGSFKGINRI